MSLWVAFLRGVNLGKRQVKDVSREAGLYRSEDHHIIRFRTGSVANSKSRTWSAIRFRPVLRRDAEQSMDELTLAHCITLCQPADLSFAYRVHGLVAFDGSPGSFRRPESEAGDDALLMNRLTRGPIPLPADKASRRKSFAAVRSRLGDSMKSMVSPAESTARYR